MKKITYNSLNINFPLLSVKKPRRCPASPTFFASIKEKLTAPLCYNLFFTCSLLIIFQACREDQAAIELPIEKKSEYIFLGHIYNKTNRVDPRLESIDYRSYKGVWLGGDLCSETTKDRSTLGYLDNLFDLKSEDTHWAVGNHDVRNGNLDWIKAATGRNLFYTHSKDGLTIAVIDSNLGHVVGRESTCEERVEQSNFITNLLDTLQSGSHLVLLTHWVIWGATEPMIPCEALANNCLSTFQFLCADGSSRFPPFLYQQLVALEERGIEVIMVSGDGGIFTKQYHYQTEEGIDFLISGIFSTLDRNNPPTNVTVNLNPDSVLIFHHDVEEEQLEWEFVQLDELVE